MDLHTNSTPATPYERVLARLRDVKRQGDGRRAMATCPAHEDRASSSLSITEAPDGKVLVHCHAQPGCTLEQVLEAAQLKKRDLFPGDGPHKPVKLVATYDYKDAAGNVVLQSVRYEPKSFKQRRPDGKGGWIWNLKDVETIPYRLPELLAADPDAWICVTEGEKDADGLAALGFVATTNPGGAGKFKAEFDEYFEDRKVAIFADNDQPGAAHAKMVAAILAPVAREVRIIEPPPAMPIKGDVSDLIAMGWDLELLLKRIERAPVYSAACRSIIEDNEQFPVIAQQAFEALKQRNNPARLFRYADNLVRVENDANGRAFPARLDADGLRTELCYAANWLSKRLFPKKPSSDLGRLMLKVTEPPLPRLARMIYGPVITPDGRVLTEPGYDKDSGFYLAPFAFELPTVPERPTSEDVLRASQIIFEDLLVDFPFATEGDRAAAGGLVLLRPARALIDGPTPLHDSEGPVPGAGKGLLIDAGLGATGEFPALLSLSSNLEEQNKTITAALVEGHDAISFDNASGFIKSTEIAKGLTSTLWGGRMLGRTAMVSVPNYAIWTITGNNLLFDRELSRRVQRIRIVPQCESPEQRTGFKHPNLRTWVAENRGILTWAALVLIRNWVSLGCPDPKVGPLGSYESWTRVIGGILECASVKGFLTNRVEPADVATSEGSAWRDFLNRWWERYESAPVLASELFQIARMVDGFPMGRKETEQGQKVAFGIRLAKARDQVIDRYQIVDAGRQDRAVLWKLKLLPEVGK